MHLKELGRHHHCHCLHHRLFLLSQMWNSTGLKQLTSGLSAFMAVVSLGWTKSSIVTSHKGGGSTSTELWRESLPDGCRCLSCRSSHGTTLSSDATRSSAAEVDSCPANSRCLASTVGVGSPSTTAFVVHQDLHAGLFYTFHGYTCHLFS